MITRESILRLIDIYWEVGKELLIQQGGESRCGVSCTKNCCGTQSDTKEFTITPLWPGDIKDVKRSLYSKSSITYSEIIAQSKTNKHGCCLWNRETKECTIYNSRPVMCRVFGLPFAIWDLTETRMQPACPENPLPGKPVVEWKPPCKVDMVILQEMRGIGKILEMNINWKNLETRSFNSIVLGLIKEVEDESRA